MALRAILALKQKEERRSGQVHLVFNGDFNWFDLRAHSQRDARQRRSGTGRAQRRKRLRLRLSRVCRSGRIDPTPSWVSCKRSPLALLNLRAASREVAGQRIGVLHGDPEGLAGWSFAVEAMPPSDATLCAGAVLTTRERIEAYFRAADVAAFACSHTCLPFLQDFHVDGNRRVIINNGAAGMPNFRASNVGVLTRISSHPAAPNDSLYGTALDAVRFDALAIHYDQQAWLKRFLANWPAGSPAHVSYFTRISRGPEFSRAQALRIGLRA